MEQLGSHWMDIRKLLYLNILRKPLEKIQVPLKSVKNIGSYAERMYSCDKMSLNSS